MLWLYYIFLLVSCDTLVQVLHGLSVQCQADAKTNRPIDLLLIWPRERKSNEIEFIYISSIKEMPLLSAKFRPFYSGLNASSCINQWERTLHYNVVSHRLHPYPEWLLLIRKLQHGAHLFPDDSSNSQRRHKRHCHAQAITHARDGTWKIDPALNDPAILNVMALTKQAHTSYPTTFFPPAKDMVILSNAGITQMKIYH